MLLINKLFGGKRAYNSKETPSGTGYAWQGAIIGLGIASVIVVSLTIGEVFLGRWSVLTALAYSFVTSAAFVVPVWLFSRLLGLAPAPYRWTLLAVTPLLLSPFMFADAKGAIITAAGIAFAASIAGAPLFFLIRCRWSATALRQRVAAIVGLSLGAGILIFGGLWLFGAGSDVPGPVNAALMAQNSIPKQLDIPDPSQPGRFQMHTLSYGSGKYRHRL